jgi:hypothetical protein
MLEDAARVRFPGSATNLGDKDALPVEEFALVTREFEVFRFGGRFDKAPAVPVSFIVGLVILGCLG